MRTILSTLVVIGLTLSPLLAQAPQKLPTYWQDVRPVLRKNCTFCHTVRHIKKLDVSGGLALNDYQAVRAAIARKIIRPGDSANSPLIQRLIVTDPNRRMPLDDDPLPKASIDLLSQWIDAGAKEGTPPDDQQPQQPRIKIVKRLPVTFTTRVTPPKSVLGKIPSGPLALSLRIGPLAPVTALCFSPNDRLLAAGRYGQVVVWDLEKAVPAAILTNVLGAVNDLRFTPDGRLLIVAGGQPSARGDIRIYDTSDWKLKAVFRDHHDVAYAIDVSPDGKVLASASFDTTIRLWDLSSFQPLETIDGHSDFVYDVAFSPDGKLLASASKDRSVRLFDIAKKKTRYALGGMAEDVLTVAFDATGKHVVSSGFETALYWWDVTSGEKKKTQRGHGVAVHEIARSKDGKLLLSAAADRTLRLWNGTSGAAIRSIRVGSPAYCAAISSHGKWLACGSFDGKCRLYDAKGQERIELVSAVQDESRSYWLVTTPQGYVSASSDAVQEGRWTVRGRTVDASRVWQSLRRPDLIVTILETGKAPVPQFK